MLIKARARCEWCVNAIPWFTVVKIMEATSGVDNQRLVCGVLVASTLGVGQYW